jgi:hypothetical protein
MNSIKIIIMNSILNNKKIRIFSLMMVFASVIAIGFFMQSCSSNIDELNEVYSNATHYFLLGTSSAQVCAIGNNAIAYGYGFATGTVTISLTFNHPNYTVSFSGTLGSNSGGTGQHTHPLHLQ